MSIIHVLRVKRAFSDILEGVTSKNFSTHSARVLDALFLLCLQLLTYSLYNCACSVNKISV